MICHFVKHPCNYGVYTIGSVIIIIKHSVHIDRTPVLNYTKERGKKIPLSPYRNFVGIHDLRRIIHNADKKLRHRVTNQLTL